MNTPLFYKLIGKLPVPCNLKEMDGSIATCVAITEVGPLCVSTVFLGVNHNFGEGDAILFETMIFGNYEDNYQERYCTWSEAEIGHERAVEMAKELVRNAKVLLGEISDDSSTS